MTASASRGWSNTGDRGGEHGAPLAFQGRFSGPGPDGADPLNRSRQIRGPRGRCWKGRPSSLQEDFPGGIFGVDGGTKVAETPGGRCPGAVPPPPTTPLRPLPQPPSHPRMLRPRRPPELVAPRLAMVQTRFEPSTSARGYVRLSPQPDNGPNGTVVPGGGKEFHPDGTFG